LGSRYFPLLLTDIERNDRIVLSTQDVTQGWNVLPSANMVSILKKSVLFLTIWTRDVIKTVRVWDWQDYVASDYIPCLQQPSDLEHVDTLMLRGQSAKLNGMLTVSINREHRRPSSLKISFSLSAAGVIPSVSSAGLVR
jgi:hypothetical protein